MQRFARGRVDVAGGATGSRVRLRWVIVLPIVGVPTETSSVYVVRTKWTEIAAACRRRFGGADIVHFGQQLIYGVCHSSESI